MNKNRNAQANVGSLLVACFLFVMLITGGFTFYLGSLAANDVTPPDGIDEAKLNERFSKFNETYQNTSDTAKTERNRIPVFSDIADFFAAGTDSIKATLDSIGFIDDYKDFAQENTELGNLLPDSFWNLLGAVLGIIVTFIGLSALWRWNFTR